MAEEKTFTQDEVNTIVQDRLAKEKEKHKKELADLQTDIVRREKRLDAQERLAANGYPKELVDLVNFESDETFSTSLDLIEKTYKQQQQPEKKHNSYSPVSGGVGAHDPIRDAMGLNN